MSTSIENIKMFLEEREVKYLYDQEKEVFIMSFAPNVILVKLEEGGEFLQFRTLNFFQYKKGKYRENILLLLASMNYNRKLVKFGYDQEDGEINGCIDVPIEDGNFTPDQFFRCIASLLEALEEARERITYLIETGEDPGPNLTPKVIDDLVQEIMDSMDTIPLDENEDT